jgi:two-component system OmpR family response regulator
MMLSQRQGQKPWVATSFSAFSACGAGIGSVFTMRILIVEDERKMAAVLKKGLEAENHRVSLAVDGRTALEFASALEFDVVVLDVMLPGIDGFEVARRLRRSQNQTPILMLTARDTVPDVVKGLDSGADDYLTKPFSFEIFLARLRSIARRGSAPRPTLLEVANLVLDPATHQVMRAGQEIHLSLTEFRLLEFLMRRADRVVSRNAIIQAVWDFEDEVEANTLDAFIRLLRSKVDRDHKLKLIQTVRGAGYMIRDDSRT